MKAIRYNRYGPPEVLEYKEVEKPDQNSDQVLLNIHAASINTADLTFTGGLPIHLLNGWSRPKDPRVGTDVAGRIEAVGSNVRQFQPGDEVFGVCSGSFAEYGLGRADRLVLKPANISFEEAAAAPVAAITAVQGLRDKGQIKPGQKVLIHGASGAVGTFAVQIAKAFGAEVTGVCSTGNVDMVRSIGADKVIDYTKENFVISGMKYDLILAINGYHSILEYKRALSPEGIYVMVGASRSHIFQALLQTAFLGPLISKTSKQKMGFMGIAKMNQNDLAFLSELFKAQKVVPVIDRRYPLSKTAEAAQYLLEGHAKAKVIITIPGNEATTNLQA